MPISAIDDRDPLVTYSSGWGHAGVDKEFNSTTTWTGTVGATARITFSGSSIAVYGTVATRGLISQVPTSLYTVDASLPVRYVASPTLVTQYNQLFFQAANLTDAQHTLTVTNAVAEAVLFLDLFIITPSVSPSSASVSVMTTTITPSAITVTVTPVIPTPDSFSLTTVRASPSSTAAGATSASGTQKTNTAAIAGGVIGAILILFLTIMGALLYRRRLKKNREESETTFFNNFKANPTGGSVVPFSLATPPYGSQQFSQPEMTQPNGPYQGDNMSQYSNPYPNQYPTQQPTPNYAYPNSAEPPPTELAYYSANHESSIPSNSYGYGNNANQYVPPSQVADYSSLSRGVPLPQGGSGVVNELPWATENGGRVRINLDG